jgi:rhomboid family GlyGly-CTERM serine protease
MTGVKPPKSEPAPSRRPDPAAVPWIALAFSAGAVALHFFAGWREAAFYLRAEVFGGEVWRLWTGHLVHFSGSHLFWNLAVFVPSAMWLERLDRRGGRVFLLVASPLISLLLLAFDPSLLRYGGLSGLATGTLVLLALLQLARRDPREPAWFWWGVLGIVAAKLVGEQVTKTPLLASNMGDVRTVPLAHLGGALCAAAAWAWRRGAMRMRARG